MSKWRFGISTGLGGIAAESKASSSMLKRAIGIIAELTDLDALKSYLTMPPASKGRDLAANFGQDFLEYLLHTGEEDLAAVVQAEIDKNEFLDFPFLETLPDKAFVGFLQNLPEVLTEGPHAPTYLFLDYTQDVADEWLIHGTNSAAAVESEGFTRGVWDYATLGLTTWFKDEVKSDGGFNFAFYAQKFSESDVTAYGKEAVVFMASGIETWHYSDQQRQIIFLGATAHDIHAIQRSSYGDYYASLGEEEFTGSMQECANWIMENV